MKAIARRIRRLEENCTSKENEHARRMLEAIRESRRRRLAAEGKEPEPELPRRREDYFDASGRPLSIAEIIIRARGRFEREPGMGIS